MANVELPVGWARSRLGDPRVADIVMGQSPTSASYNTDRDGLPFFQGKADFGMKYPTPTKWCSAPAKVAEPGDILISVRAPVGDVNVAAEKCCVGRGLGAIRHGEDADGDYLFYFLMNVKEKLAELGTGAIFASINKKVLLDFEIEYPAAPEQRAIADVLSKLQRAVEAQDKIIASLKELKGATLAKLFREGLRGEPLKETEIGGIPESWEVVKLSQVADFASGGTPSKANPAWWSGTIPWASPKDMKVSWLSDTQDHISEDAAKRGSRVVPAGSIFVVVRGMILARDVPVAMTTVPMAFNQDMRAILPKKSADPCFLLYAIAARKAALTEEISTSSHGTRRMSASAVESLQVPFPADKEEQRSIGRALRTIEERELTAVDMRSLLEKTFSSMLHLLMTGEVRVATLAH